MATETRVNLGSGTPPALPEAKIEPTDGRRASQLVEQGKESTSEVPPFIVPEPEEPLVETDHLPPSSRALRFLAMLAVCYTLYFARAILLPLALAIVLSLLLRPIVRWMSRRHIPETLGASLCLLALGAILTIGIMQLITPAQKLAADFPQMMSSASTKLKGITAHLRLLSRATDQIEKMAAGTPSDCPQ